MVEPPARHLSSAASLCDSRDPAAQAVDAHDRAALVAGEDAALPHDRAAVMNSSASPGQQAEQAFLTNRPVPTGTAAPMSRCSCIAAMEPTA